MECLRVVQPSCSLKCETISAPTAMNELDHFFRASSHLHNSQIKEFLGNSLRKEGDSDTFIVEAIPKKYWVSQTNVAYCSDDHKKSYPRVKFHGDKG